MQDLLLFVIVVLCVAALASAYLRRDDAGSEQDGADAGEAGADFDALANVRSSLEQDIAAQRRAAAAKFGQAALREGHEL